MDSPPPSALLSPSNSSIGDYFETSLVAPILLPQGQWTLQGIVSACNNFKLPEGPFSAKKLAYDKSISEDYLVPFFLLPLPEQSTSGDVLPIGFLRRPIVKALREDNGKMESMKCDQCWRFYGDAEDPWAVSFEDWFTDTDTREQMLALRTEHLDRLVRGWKETGLFPEVLHAWRDEKYTIYGPHISPNDARGTGSIPSPLPGGNVAFLIERAATSLFAFASFGVHMTGYLLNPQTKEYTFWVPRRAKTKPTFPGMLDNTVAGGISEYDSPLETMIRECEEEASLSETFVQHRLRSAGLVSYVRLKDGWINPEVEYTYDLLFPDSKTTIPKPNDDEVEAFNLYSTKQVLEFMLAGEFKPNCALVMIDFFIRHGLLSYETDTGFVDICQQLRSRFPLPGPH